MKKNSDFLCFIIVMCFSFQTVLQLAVVVNGWQFLLINPLFVSLEVLWALLLTVMVVFFVRRKRFESRDEKREKMEILRNATTCPECHGRLNRSAFRTIDGKEWKISVCEKCNKVVNKLQVTEGTSTEGA